LIAPSMQASQDARFASVVNFHPLREKHVYRVTKISFVSLTFAFIADMVTIGGRFFGGPRGM